MIDKLTFSSAANQRICGKRFGYSSGLVVIDIAVNSQVSFLNPDNIILPAAGRRVARVAEVAQSPVQVA
jgi:hypothetical protein